jgi:NAD(P)H-dependent flavin oxidoreductase YrpB (nitropropane dioxygenase family)
MAELTTPLCRLLGIEVPIVQAPIGTLATPELAAAVAESGALGMVTAGGYEPAQLPDLLARLAELTSRPVGITLNIRRDQSARLSACLDAGARVIHVFWGDPSDYVAPCRGAGAVLMATVASPAEARRAAGAGVDVIVAQGWEAGGHVWGQVATLPLIPAVVDAVSPVPVIAAGGVGDGRGLAAVLVLGAQAAWLGTRFVMAAEAPAHDHYRDRISRAAITDTCYSELFDVGWPEAPARVLRNTTVRDWEAAGAPKRGRRPGEGDTVAWLGAQPCQRYGTAAPIAGMTGDVEALAMYAGQSAGLITDVQPAAEIIRRLTEQARTALAVFS